MAITQTKALTMATNIASDTMGKLKDPSQSIEPGQVKGKLGKIFKAVKQYDGSLTTENREVAKQLLTDVKEMKRKYDSLEPDKPIDAKVQKITDYIQGLIDKS